jgi:hypothetical protein
MLFLASVREARITPSGRALVNFTPNGRIDSGSPSASACAAVQAQVAPLPTEPNNRTTCDRRWILVYTTEDFGSEETQFAAQRWVDLLRHMIPPGLAQSARKV